jgi:hypothetical protein
MHRSRSHRGALERIGQLSDHLRLVESPRIRCREVGEADLDAIADLLATGFPDHSRDFWALALARLSGHPTPSGYPKYGYLLEYEGRPVGIILLISSCVEIDGERKVRCYTSSWYVEPAFRIYAPLLAAHAVKDQNVTYINVTPAGHTIPILEAQGYRQYSRGLVFSVPALSIKSRGACVSLVTDDIRPDDDLSSAQIELLLLHQRYGCLSVICHEGNRRYPFVFISLPACSMATIAGAIYSYLGDHLLRRDSAAGYRPALLGLSLAYLIYCPAYENFVRFAGPLGRFLARRGMPFVVLDADGPVNGLIGWYSDAPKYFKGPNPPHLGDLAYSEWVILGLEPLYRGKSGRKHLGTVDPR